jgi:hypothetical protein
VRNPRADYPRKNPKKGDISRKESSVTSEAIVKYCSTGDYNCRKRKMFFVSVPALDIHSLPGVCRPLDYLADLGLEAEFQFFCASHSFTIAPTSFNQ